MIISNVYIYNTPLRTFRKGVVFIHEDTISYVSDTPAYDGPSIDGQGRYLIPGLLDIHMHIESSMTTPAEFSNSVLSHGTTTVVADAHEVANVFGYDGLIEYMDHDQVLDVFYAIPSSVPSTGPHLETTGGQINEEDVARLCTHPKVIALGEIMNFKDIVSSEDTLTKRIIRTFKHHKPLAPIEGHCPRIAGHDLARFIAAGITSDHTHQDPASIREKISAGLFLQIQEKSINAETIAVLNDPLLFPYFSFVTDDVMPDHLIEKGHLDHLLKLAHHHGMRMEDALYCATYTPAMRMQRYDRGMIAPGKIADFILLDDLETFTIHSVYKSGKLAYDQDGLHLRSKNKTYPPSVSQSIHRDFLQESDLVLHSSKEKVSIRAIQRDLMTTFTTETVVNCRVIDGVVDWQSQGLNLLCVVERYGHHRPLQFAFVTNGFSADAAMASSWAHDHHNILVMGTSIRKMVQAANRLIEVQGGILVIDQDDHHHLCPLPYGGIVSLASMEVLAREIVDVRQSMADCGYVSHNELMSFATLSLLVSPALKVSDYGYVDVRSQMILPWEVGE